MSLDAKDWEGYFVTFIFKQLPGSPMARREQMRRSIEGFYNILLTRMLRWPRHPRWAPHRPIGIFAPDCPSSKKGNSQDYDLVVNDGEHWHGVLWVSPLSRLTTPLDEHLRNGRDRYEPPGGDIRKIHVERIRHSPDRVTSYALKAIDRGLFSVDELLLLPRAISELEPKQDRLRR